MKLSNALLMLCLAISAAPLAADEVGLTLRYRVETSAGSGRYHTLTRGEKWDLDKTAVIVCDMWNLHHCLNAVRRVGEMAPRMNEVLNYARSHGATIVHAPSSCMKFYEKHPARLRAQSVPKAAKLPEQIASWCYSIPSEEQGQYPIDQSNGGEDDDLKEHAAWAKKLEGMGLNPRAPWTRETADLGIDEDRDYISDNGEEIWSILEARGIDNVILLGVHANMCVLGRPFGLRQMAKNGKHVVLMRDMTDTMYDPRQWPYVSHFTGTDLIVAHVEKFVCPSITSDQLIGGKEFRFKHDKRPNLAVVIAEDEYKTEETLPPFANHTLGKNFRVNLVFGSDTERNDIPGLDVVNDADVLLISIRRRTLPKEQLDIFRRFADAGKPMVGIRTASHAFCIRNKPAPKGLADWPEFDHEVWGGNYTNHYGNGLKNHVSIEAPFAGEHPVLAGLKPGDEIVSDGSLYRVSPLAMHTEPLLYGRVEGKDAEPVAWTFTRANGGKSFYTSLGHPGDFQQSAFRQLLANAVYDLAGLPTPAPVSSLESLKPPAKTH